MKILEDFFYKIIYTPDYYFDKLSKSDFVSDKKIILILSTGWFKAIRIINLVKSILGDNFYKLNNIILMANSKPEVDFYNDQIKNLLNEKTKITVVFCSKNVFTNENIFNIKPAIQKKYDMVINSKFVKFKRTYLANLCPNILQIGYYDTDKQNNNVPNFGTLVNFTNNLVSLENYKKLNDCEITICLNESKMGGIFSEVEGQCRASGEYLLCGLPVISTVCSGGREVFYNKKNSIICEDNEKSVFDSYKIAIEKINSDEFKPEEIRKDYLCQINEHRSRLLNEIKKIFDYDNEELNTEILKLKLFE